VNDNMEYAIDKSGKLIHHKNAIKGKFYKCPYCKERVYVRRGLNACFFHERKSNRTPLQKCCPEYHEGTSYGKTEKSLSCIYLDNGGIPLYLCNYNNQFELRAYFPSISNKSLQYLREKGVKIHVNTKSTSFIDRRTYTVDNLNFYPVRTTENWIDIVCEPGIDNQEIRRKWLCGIRGIDVQKDIYYCGSEGGYRVALGSEIIIGRHYRIMFYDNAPNIEGIGFIRVGYINLKKDYVDKKLSIYEMVISRRTEAARKFIESKGYKLVGKSNKLIPLWPPGAFKGNEIIFNRKKAYFLHINPSGKSKLYYSRDNELVDLYSDRNNIILLKLDQDDTIITSEVKNEISNYEILYSITYSESLVRKEDLKQEIIIKNSNDKIIKSDTGNLELPKDRRLFITSNVPFCAVVKNKNYVISSSSLFFENIWYNHKLIIDSKAFGTKEFTFNRNETRSMLKKINWDLEYSKLYRCNAPPTIPVSNRYIKLLYIISQLTNINNKNVYKLLETWIKTNSIPVTAVKHLDELLNYLGGLANERRA